MKNSLPQPQDSFGVKLIITITTVRKPKSFLTNFAAHQQPSWRSGKVISLMFRRSLDQNPLMSNFFFFFTYRNCKNLDFKPIQSDTVDSIEISMYRPNLSLHTHCKCCLTAISLLYILLKATPNGKRVPSPSTRRKATPANEVSCDLISYGEDVCTVLTAILC